MPACLPEQLWWSGSGGRPSWTPHSSSRSRAGAVERSRRTASSCSGSARCEAHAIATSRSPRSSRARTSGSAWIGFDEERRKSSSPGSPERSTTSPSRTATAWTRCLDSTTGPRRTTTWSGSTTGTLARVENGPEFSYGRDMSPVPASELEYEAEETMLVAEPEQLRALADGLRGRIVGLLRERAWSTQQLARELDVPKGTVGHHLKVLERAGLIRVVHTRQVRAVTEKFYGRVAKLFLFKAEDPEEGRALGAAALRDAAFHLERAPREAGSGWGMVLSRLSPRDVARFDRRLE